MSTNYKPYPGLEERFYLTQFWGGAKRGPCLQITQPGHCIQLTKAEAAALAEALRDWIAGGLTEAD